MRGLQGRFVPVALEAQCLEILGLCGEGLVHGNDVSQLAHGCGDGGRAELVLIVLLREQGLPRSGRIAAGLEKVKEDLARRARQTLPVIGEPRPWGRRWVRGTLAWARLFLRRRTTSILWQMWSGLWQLTSGGSRGNMGGKRWE